MNYYEDRQQIKDEQRRYRLAAERLTGVKPRELVAVNEDANKTGEFIEINVWVPREEMEKEA